MEIPPEKKPMFYLVSIPVFLVGLVLGALLISYVFFQTKDTVCRLWQAPEINTALTSTQIQQAASLEQNRTIFGRVASKEAASFALEFPVVNPLDAKNSTTTTIKIPFDQNKDEVIKLETVPAKTSSAVKETAGSFSDIKVGEQILLKVLDGKKTIYIPSS